MFKKIWDLVKDMASGFMADEALSQAAAIAYFDRGKRNDAAAAE